MTGLATVTRPPVGFVVEGHGEYNCYPSFCSRLLNISGVKIPVVNARGNGGILKRLEEHLLDIVTTHHPLAVIVSIDLSENIKGGAYVSCKALKDDLTSKIDCWREQSAASAKLQPFPEYFHVVVQVPKFESWLIADKTSLFAKGLLSQQQGEADWGNVDSEEANPASWMKNRSSRIVDLKDPSTCKMIGAALDLDTVAAKSKSFAKLKREVQTRYDRWQHLVNQEIEVL